MIAAAIRMYFFDVDIWSQVYYNENKWINLQMGAFIDFIKEELTTEK